MSMFTYWIEQLSSRLIESVFEMVIHSRMHMSKKCVLHCFLGCLKCDLGICISCEDSGEEHLL